MKLCELVENPDNPQEIDDESFNAILRFVDKNPIGLTADRIAFVTDHPAGKRVVLQGNKRLRALKRIFGDDAEVPDDWFQDITVMTDDQRSEFIVDANVNDGRMDSAKLLAMYDRDELAEWIGPEKIGDVLAVVESSPSPASAEADGQGSAAVKLVELKIILSSADFKCATDALRRRSDDLSRAFMEVVNARA